MPVGVEDALPSTDCIGFSAGLAFLFFLQVTETNRVIETNEQDIT